MFEGEPPASIVDALLCPDGTAAYLASAPPGPDAAAPLSVLDASRLSHAGRVDALVACERQIAWLQAAQQRLLAAMSAPHSGDTVDRSAGRWVREDVGCALRLSGLTAQRRLAVAETLAEQLPVTLNLLATGQISYLHAMNLAEATYGLAPESATAVEARVLRRAAEQTLSEFKQSVRRAVASVSPATVESQREQAMSERRVVITPRDDAMAELWALLPAEGAAALRAAIDSLASVTSAADPRRADQRRADALVDLGVAALHDPLLPRSQGLRPAVQVTVAASTLLGCDDQPGELAGHGPVPAALARRLAADPTGTWRRLVTDPATGQLIDYGRSTYRPPVDLAAFVVARDQVCLFPGCNRPARQCQLDHRVSWASAGATSAENVGALCTRHHIGKHDGGWRLERAADGSHRWTAPTGHRYRSHSPGYPADQLARPHGRVQAVPIGSAEHPDAADPDPPPF